MKFSQLSILTSPAPADVVIGLDIDGGNGQTPSLRLITFESIIELAGNSNSANLQTAIDTLNGQIVTVNTTLQSLQTQINSSGTSAQISNLSDALNAYVSSNNAAIAQLQTQINSSATSSQFTQISNTLNAYVISNNAAIAQLQALVNSSGTNLTQQLNDFSTTLSTLNNTVSNNSQGISNIFAIVNAQDGQIDLLTNTINALPKQVFPTSFEHFHDNTKIVTGGALIFTQQAASIYATNWQQSPAAINDSFTFSKLLAAGTYTFSMLVTRSSNKGDLQLYIDGVLAFNDFVGYNATQVYERVTRTITIANDGLHNFVFTIYKKNASSTGYAFLASKFSAYKN